MRFTGLLRGVFGFLALVTGHAAFATPAGYTYYSVGDVAAKTPGKTDLGLMLVGGGGWDLDAYRWFFERAGHGHIVILSASADAEAGESYYREIGGIASVETLTFDDRKASSDPRVLAILRRADGIFIGGGDQSNYVRFWKGTPVEDALNRHVANGKPIGGTSAGLAILGFAAYGSMDGRSIESITALADPMDPGVTIVHDFLKVPYLQHIVTDTHFKARDRLGRLIAFLAQVRMTDDPKAVGIGVDEKTALCVDAKGIGRLFTSGSGYAWLVEPQGQPAMARGPLDWPEVKITGIGPESVIDLKTLKVASPAFGGTASVKGGRVSNVPIIPGSTWSLAIHGGAGVVERQSMTAANEAEYRKGLDEALRAGAGVLEKGGSSLDAVEASVRVLEDNPLFNAGKGAVFDSQGTNELDAAIMDGPSLKAGAVAGVTRTRNPVSLARAVMERSSHVMLAGAGADLFSKEQGLDQVDPTYFRTDARWREYLEWKKAQDVQPVAQHHFGTVGAVARDMFGHVAAATSTGGLTGKKWGRIGDSPLIGAGTYAEADCAVSATGTGEYFMRTVAAHQVCDRLNMNKQTIDSAAQDVIDEIEDMGGEGAIMAMDRSGHVAFSMNSEGMYRGSVSSNSPPRTAIYSAETTNAR